MSKLRLTIATGDYDIIRPLKDGEVTADGIDLVFLTRMGSLEFINRMVKRREFDVSEVGATYAINAAAGKLPPGLAFIPIFPHRRFRHGFIFVNPNSNIKTPKDLIGQRVGAMYQAAGNIWVRGILQEHYGVNYKDVKWIGERMGMYETTPSWHEMADHGVRLQDMLAEGKIAALICPDLPPLLMKKDPRIAQMFPDYESEEISYFKKTGIFPIMHTVAIQQDIVERNPWVTTNLIKAFDESKRLAYRRMSNPRNVPLAFSRSTWEKQQKLLGPDPWEYGLGPSNRKNLETMARYMAEQEMFDRAPAVDDMFAPFDLSELTPDDWH